LDDLKKIVIAGTMNWRFAFEKTVGKLYYLGATQSLDGCVDIQLRF
jgi:hypothetical protein